MMHCIGCSALRVYVYTDAQTYSSQVAIICIDHSPRDVKTRPENLSTWCKFILIQNSTRLGLGKRIVHSPQAVKKLDRLLGSGCVFIHRCKNSSHVAITCIDHSPKDVTVCTEKLDTGVANGRRCKILFAMGWEKSSVHSLHVH